MKQWFSSGTNNVDYKRCSFFFLTTNILLKLKQILLLIRAFFFSIIFIIKTLFINLYQLDKYLI